MKMIRTTSTPLAVVLFATTLMGLGTGCELRQRMYDQPRFEALEATDFFGDRRSSRPLVEGTVARGHLNEDTHLYQGKVDGEWATTLPELPFEDTAAVLARGRERYNISCAPCHGESGYGNGMVVQRGYQRPTSYHTDAIRARELGYFFDVITKGLGGMPSYGDQVKIYDRWAIAAYLRALQLSQNAPIALLSEEEQNQL